MPSPLLARILPHLIAAAGYMGASQAQQRGLGSMITNPRGAGRSFFRDRGAPETGRWIFGTRESMPHRKEMWGDLRENVQQLVPETRAFSEVMKEARASVEDVKKGGFGGLLSGLIRMTRAVDRTSASLIEMQTVLASYSGAHAAAVAQLEVDRIYRSIEMGRATGPSFRQLTESRSRLEQSMMPFRRAGTILTDRVVAVVTDAVAAGLRILERVEPITELIEAVLGGDTGEGAPGTSEPFMESLGAGLGVRPRNRRRRY